MLAEKFLMFKSRDYLLKQFGYFTNGTHLVALASGIPTMTGVFTLNHTIKDVNLTDYVAEAKKLFVANKLPQSWEFDFSEGSNVVEGGKQREVTYDLQINKDVFGGGYFDLPVYKEKELRGGYGL